MSDFTVFGFIPLLQGIPISIFMLLTYLSPREETEEKNNYATFTSMTNSALYVGKLNP
jgi:Na+/melibiose symporter-like transporter